MGTVVGTRGRIRTCDGALNRRLRCRFATLVSEPLDRLERSSPGYGPGTSPSTLERQRATAVPLDDRRLADVRYAVCQRVLLYRPLREAPRLGSAAFQLQAVALRTRATDERSLPVAGV